MAIFHDQKTYFFFYKLPYRHLINRKIKKPHRKRCCYYVFFGSFHTKLNLLLYVSEILLKLSENPRDWQRISFMLYKEFNQTEKVRTQLYLIISDIIRWRNFPLRCKFSAFFYDFILFIVPYRCRKIFSKIF